MDILIKNGTVVSGSNEERLDVLIRGEKIVRTAPEISPEGGDVRVIDAEGCLVFPGFIDAHTHLDMECAAGVTADDFTTGTRAAVAGGTTTIVDFATQDKGETLSRALANWHRKADGRSACDYAFHMAITDWTEDIPEQMAEMCKEGVTSFKVYLAYDNLRLTPEQVGKVLTAAGKLGAVVGAHCEDGDAVNSGIARQKELGNMSPAAHPLSRPNQVEADSVKQFLALAKDADAEAYVVHLSTAEGLEVIRQAREGGQTVWAETCPQYVTLTDEVYSLPDFEGAKFVCSPPIRSAKDRDALRAALRDGDIQVMATDHCSFRFKGQKDIGKDDFSKIPNGLPGIEHRPAVIYGLSKGECPMSASRLCGLMSENPAKIYGMYPQKGSLLPGADADIVIWDTNAPMTIRAESQLQNTDYTPFEGLTIPGSPRMVLLRGEIAAENGRVSGNLHGKFVSRSTR